jgi:hypothetical protein
MEPAESLGQYSGEPQSDKNNDSKKQPKIAVLTATQAIYVRAQLRDVLSDVGNVRFKHSNVRTFSENFEC